MLYANFHSLLLLTEMCLLDQDIYHYINVAQGKITIPGVDDAEESLLTDVSKGTPQFHFVQKIMLLLN